MTLHADPKQRAPLHPLGGGPGREGTLSPVAVVAAVAMLVVGIVVGIFVVGPLFESEPPAVSASAGRQESPAVPPVQWRLESAFPTAFPQQGALALSLAQKINRMSGDALQISVYEPDALVPTLQIFDAVASGTIDAAWSTPGLWFWREKALALFSAVPFGPDVREYLAWVYDGGGSELLDALYGRYGIKSLICGVGAPEAAGWFRQEINSPSDLDGLRMRSMGLGAKVLERLGVSVQPLTGGNIYAAMAKGIIDAAEYAQPSIDVNLGLDLVAKHYYFPGWQQQTNLFDLMINANRWATLTDAQQAQVEAACGDTVRESLALSEALQGRALAELRRRGVTLHRWPSSFLAKLDQAWRGVVADLSAEDPNFEAVWQSLQAFRRSYATWRKLGYLN
jgi:TRAP-type mannitol/chloroaromatic compound transport system substrate-binding protein